MNTFGTTQVQVALVDPRDARDYRRRFELDAIPELQYANSLYCPLGKYPARGWILLARGDYDSIRGYGTDYRLVLDSTTFRHLSIVQARCVTRGIANDPGAIYLVELTDKRGLLWNRFFKFPTESYYNMLAPAYPERYYEDSGNHTWSTMIRDLWLQMPYLGAFPGLATSVTEVPYNWDLQGVSAWEALCAMLRQLGMGISVNLMNAVPYGIVRLGATDAAFNTLQSANCLQDDLEWIDLGAGRVPGSVVVYFRRVNQYYGTEETVRRDTLQYVTNSVYSVTIPAPVSFLGAVGTHFLHDDFIVRYNTDGTPLAADTALANIIAIERVNQYFDNIYAGTSGNMNRTYAGIVPFYAGSLCDGVCWKQDMSQHRLAWQTQVLRGELWPLISEGYGARL